MEAEGNLVSGGVTLLHTECEGKHSYEVKGFLNYNKGMFTSKGDKVLMINNTHVEDLTPEAFVDLLVEGSPLLTIHQPCNTKREECESEELRVKTKESTVMSFSLNMVRESKLEEFGSQEPAPPPECDDIEGDSVEDSNLLIVYMADTRYNLVVARGCDPENPCNNCGKTNCQFNEIVVLPAKAEIASSSPKNLRLLSMKNNVFLKSLLKENYVTPYNHQLYLDSTMSAPITIYTYTARAMCGVPVLLNFTDTENFFSCTTKQGSDTKILTVVQYKKKDLKTICADDPQQWSLVFYMSSTPDHLRRFESALHRGWFIYTNNVKTNEVDMHKDDQCDSLINTYFYVIITSEKGSILS